MKKRERKPDHESVIEITKRYTDIESKLRTVVFEPKTLSLTEHKQQIIAATKATAVLLARSNKRYADSLSGAFKEGSSRTKNAVKTALTALQRHHDTTTQTNTLSAKSGGKQAFKAVRRGAFIDLQNGMTGALATLRQTVTETIRDMDNKNRNVWDFTRAIEGKLKDGGLLEVRYENGAHIKLGHYAKMLARSSRIETENLGSFMRAQELGTNLVKCIGQSTTCELCATYRDRVFCVDGKDKRFPPLYDGANAPLRNGYHTIHPNCRCEFVPYFEEIEGKEKGEKDIAFSNRPFKDSRTKQERDAYASWQAGNRQLWTEETEFNELNRTLGEDMPYKSLGGFRKARRDFNNAVKVGRLDKNAAVEYNKYAKTKRTLQDKKLQVEIIANQPKKIEEGKQGKHICGHNNFREGKSELTISLKEAQALVDKYAGHGIIRRSESGRWNHKELIISNIDIGVCIDQKGNKCRTKSFMIHYSKSGTHIVPAKGDKND